MNMFVRPPLSARVHTSNLSSCWRRTVRCLGAATALLVGASAASAGTITCNPLSTTATPTGNYTVSMDSNGKLQVTDTTTSPAHDIVVNGGYPMFWPAAQKSSTTLSNLDITVNAAAVDDGMDITIDMANNTSSPVERATFNISRFNFSTITFQNVRNDRRTTTASYTATSSPGHVYAGEEFYPGMIFSPVEIFGDSSYTVGLSVLYPAIQYNHGLEIIRDQDDTLNGWRIRAGNYLPSVPIMDTLIPANTTYTYKVCLRFSRTSITASDNSWIGVAKPYRDYFRATYGGPRYTRDPRPVKGYQFANVSSTILPRHWVGGTQRDIDTNIPVSTDPTVTANNGFQAWANFIPSNMNAVGYQRSMIWAPTGLYSDTSPGVWSLYNYPMQAMTGADGLSYIGSSQSYLAGIPTAVSGYPIDLGFWLGRSTAYSAVWDPTSTDFVPTISLNNSTQTSAFLAELDRAVSLNADTVGLDAFGAGSAFGNGMFPRDTYVWLDTLIYHAPSVKLITEQLTADYLLTLSPSYLDGPYQTGPNPLLDYVIPGHEIWASSNGAFATPPNPSSAAVVSLLEDYASWGFIPVDVWGVASVTTGMTAADSWTTSIPSAMQSSPAVFHNALQCNLADIVSIGQQPPPDGLLTSDDYIAFTNAFYTGQPLADIVSIGQVPPPDGLVTSDDYLAFINNFFTGCP